MIVKHCFPPAPIIILAALDQTNLNWSTVAGSKRSGQLITELMAPSIKFPNVSSPCSPVSLMID